MKKTITILSLLFLASSAISQAILSSDLSTWTTGTNPDPIDFFGSQTTVPSSQVTKVSGGKFGGFDASLVNGSSSPVNLSTKTLTVLPNTKYYIKYWVASPVGEMRSGFYDTTAHTTSYNNYHTMTTGPLVPAILDSITTGSTTTAIEVILSFKNSNTALTKGMILDSIAIFPPSSPTPPSSHWKKTIYEIQHTTSTSGDSPYKDSLVETSGIVTGVASKGYFIQDTSATWNGVYVFDTNTVSIGDKVTIKGKAVEFFNLTEISKVTSFVVNSTGNTLPAPLSVTSLSVQDEKYEGVLIDLGTVICADTIVSFGEWKAVTVGTNDTVLIDDFMYLYKPVKGKRYTVKGIVNYSFGEYKINPRDVNDINELTTSLKEVNNFIFSIYPNPTNDLIQFQAKESITSIEILSIEGKLVKSISSAKSIQTIDVSGLDNGIYIMKARSNDKVGSIRFVKR